MSPDPQHIVFALMLWFWSVSIKIALKSVFFLMFSNLLLFKNVMFSESLTFCEENPLELSAECQQFEQTQ